MTQGADLRGLIARAAEGPLTREEAEAAFAAIMSGEATPVQIAGFLMVLRGRGEATREYAGAAAAMRARALKVRAPADAIDIVGTGGDGKGTLNISTAASFIVAGAGAPVAKHGNRALSSKSGAADLMGGVGVEVMTDPATVEKSIAEAGIGFMMAPVHHPAMRFVQPVRVELGARTIFNIIGPLTNPAGVTRQLTGAFSPALLRPMAETLQALGGERAWLVHGSDGADELAISGPSKVVALADGAISEFEVDPEQAGLPRHPFEDILGGDPAHNAARMLALLDGARDAYRDSAVLNAAAALIVAERAGDLREGRALAEEAIDSGRAKAALEALRRVSPKREG